ncbi:ATPase subunit 4 [Tanacetum coccineum]|uniref:ATP synthase protein MI25 n=1 Tax=Tanacetum coccineum TaxID=301880 RepID=A0ABQ5HPE6_9ASTR
MTQPSRGTIHQVELYTILTKPTAPSPIPGCFSLTKAYFVSRDGRLPLSSGKKAVFPSGRELYPIRLSHTRLAWALIETKSLPSSSLPPDPDLPFENSVGYPTELDGSTSHPLPRGEYELELDQAHCSPAMRKNAYFESSKDLLNSIRGILLNRRNIPIMSMPIESMLLAVNSNFLVFSVSSDDMMGQSFASLVPTVAAAESAIGLAIFVITFRVRGTIAGQGLSRWASASDSKARKMLFAAILSICASSSKKISIYNEEMIVARCFIGFIIFSRKSLGKTFKETLDGRIQAIQEESQQFLNPNEVVPPESNEQQRLLRISLRICGTVVESLPMARSAPKCEKTVQALLCRNLNVKSATLPNATSSRRIRLQDDLVTGFHFSVSERFVPGSTLKASIVELIREANGIFNLGFLHFTDNRLSISYWDVYSYTHLWVANTTSTDQALSIDPNTGNLIITSGGKIIRNITDIHGLLIVEHLWSREVDSGESANNLQLLGASKLP